MYFKVRKVEFYIGLMQMCADLCIFTAEIYVEFIKFRR